MDVVTLIALVEYFAKHPPTRTLVFNCNNGEEACSPHLPAETICLTLLNPFRTVCMAVKCSFPDR